MFAKGASGQIRIIYLVNEQDRIIKPLWIYNKTRECENSYLLSRR